MDTLNFLENSSGNYKKLCSHLKSTKDKFVLFAGAGINGTLLPQWKDLLGELLKIAFFRQFGSSAGAKIIKWISKTNIFTYYEQANLIRRFLGDSYLAYLHKKLYDNEKMIKTFDNETKHAFLHSVAALCTNKNVRAIINYNFDNILDTLIIKKSRKVIPIYGYRQDNQRPDSLPIFHVHGYIPYKEKTISLNEFPVIFAQDEYHSYWLQPYSWQITIPLYYLRNSVCLFIGTSLNDINMIRMLSHAREFSRNEHIYVFFTEQRLLKNDNRFKKKMREQILRVHSTLMADLGVHPIISKNDNEQIKRIKFLSELLKGENHE